MNSAGSTTITLVQPLLRGAILNRTYGIHKNFYIFAIFTININNKVIYFP